MRRALRRLTIGTAAITALTLATAPAWADGGVDVDGHGSGGSSTVTVHAEDSGSSKPKSSGGSKGSSSVSNAGSSRADNYDKPINRGSKGSSSGGGNSKPDPFANPNEWHSVPGTDKNIRAAGGLSHAIQNLVLAGRVASGDLDPAAAGVARIANALEVGQDPNNPGGGGGGGAAGQPVEQVDPNVLAQTAVSQLGLVAPEISSTPNDTDTLGAVGLPVWFWVSNPGDTTTGPASTSATAGAVTVNATATFTGMSIDMGDGETIECSGPGTEYPGTGIEPSPDCGHVYQKMSDDQPDGLYTATITAHWTVTWDSNVGVTGTIPVDLTTTKQLRIGSYQTVVTGVS